MGLVRDLVGLKGLTTANRGSGENWHASALPKQQRTRAEIEMIGRNPQSPATPVKDRRPPECH